MTTSILELQNQILKLQERIVSLEEDTMVLQLQLNLTQDSIDSVFDL